jgi:hypothetical protein
VYSHPGDPISGRTSQIKSNIKQAATTPSVSTRNLLGEQPRFEHEDVIIRMPVKSALEEAICREGQKKNDYNL